MRLRKDAEQVHLERMLPVVRPLAAGHSVYVMSYHIGSVYPLINYSGARSASRFAHLWLLPALYMDQLPGATPLRYRSPGEMSPIERFLNQAVFEDLRDQRPRVLIVLQHARDLPINGFRRLNYIEYFRRDPRIASLLDRYQLVNDLGDYLIYELIPNAQARAESPPTVQPATASATSHQALPATHNGKVERFHQTMPAMGLRPHPPLTPTAPPSAATLAPPLQPQTPQLARRPTPISRVTTSSGRTSSYGARRWC